MRSLDWQTGDRDELSAFIRSHLIAGFWGYDELLDLAHEWIDDSGVVGPDEATELVTALWRGRLAEQNTWTDTGDYGRLQYTFAQLESEGILARMCFSCCTTCATHDIDDERSPNPNPDDWYRYREWAYTYFHEQDALRLSAPEPTLYLGFSSFRPHPALPAPLVRAAAAGDDAAAAEITERTDTMVGERIVVLANHYGLDTSWSGSHRSRIELNVPHWRKPLPQ
ncbi:DUF6891 domain-containing protein [Mycolicibacterium porcinum]|uniref:DUF6891 domain-containing protein n=1 Tax=Mycolicibacterium porcinum TaxID=39693 RepID=UPI0009F184DE|nr:hypothetical protein [Mycolicibacterium porcinum]